MHKAVDKWVQAPACNAVKMGGEKMTSCSQIHFSGPDRSDLDRIGKVGCAVGDEMCRPGLRHANDVPSMRIMQAVQTVRALHAMRAIHID
ncbi:hypothetical protein A7D01_12015 [Xanthomonas arboricola]|nr:hypothetical protein A7D01_12015 [Xanthomonas arboricola]